MDEQFEQVEINPETAADIADAGAAEVPGEDDAIISLRAELSRCQEELAAAKNASLRAHADFDNFRKRLRAERDQEFARGSERVLADLLPVVDDFERALAAVNETSTVESLTQGVELIYRHVMTLLERYHIRPMDVEGKAFDPKYHDAVARVATNVAEEHTVIGQILRGYLKDQDVFRPAKVAVAVAPESPEE